MEKRFNLAFNKNKNANDPQYTYATCLLTVKDNASNNNPTGRFKVSVVLIAKTS